MKRVRLFHLVYMIEKIEGIVLDIVKHSDRHNVVTLYTRSRGRMAFLSTASKGKVGKMKNSRIMPLACISADINLKGNRDLHLLPSVAPICVWRTLYFDPVKSSLVFFLSEFLNNLLRHSQADTNLWDFIRDSLFRLDETPSDKLANFHIAFLVRLLPLVGINPPVSDYRNGDFFNMEKAEFISNPISRNAPNLLNQYDSSTLPVLSRINFENNHLFRFSRQNRQRTLSLLLRYYSLHLPVSSNLKTLEILHSLFD